MRIFMRLGSIVGLIGLLGLMSCEDNEEILPTDPDAEYDVELELNEGGGDENATVNVDANTQAEIKARVSFTSTNESMRRLYITQDVAGQGPEPFEISANADKKGDGSIDIKAENSNAIEYALDLPVPSGVDGTVVYTLWTTTGRGDYRDQTQRLAVGVGTITLNYGGANAAAEVKSYNAKLLAAPLADGSSETFISLLDGQVYRIDQGEEFVDLWDFGYYYGASNNASLASTADYPSSIINIPEVANTEDPLNNTFFAMSTTSSAEFDEVSVSGDLEFITQSNSETITGLTAGDIIEFVDDYGNKGLIRVVQVKGTDGSDDYIEIDIKVQP